MENYAGKRNNFSNGTFCPESMLRIRKDLKSLNCRSTPDPADLSQKLSTTERDYYRFSARLADFKKKQQKDFSELKSMLKDINALLPK